MAIVLAVDPGSEKSGWVIYDSDDHKPIDFGVSNNYDMEHLIEYDARPTVFAYEMIGHYGKGMPAGKSVFETCIWIGRFEKAWNSEDTFYRILNTTIRATLCGTVRAKEANIHLASKEKFPATGGGKDPYKGTKGQPGPLFGMSGHIFSALAVGLTWKEVYGKK